MQKHVSTLLEWTGPGSHWLLRNSIQTDKERKPIGEATGVYWEWKSTRVLSPWKQDHNDGGNDDDNDDDSADNEFKVHVPSVTCVIWHVS